MKTTHTCLSMILIAAVAIVAGTARAELSPGAKLAAQRAAEADAYRKMAERIMEVKVSSRTNVRQLVTGSDVIATEMNQFIKGIRINPDRVVLYEDGTCEVTAEVTMEKVTTTIKTVCDKYYDGDDWTKDSFKEINKDISRDVITVVGSGAAAEGMHMPDPATLEYIRPKVTTGARKLNLPSIYRKYSGQKRLLAKRAAEVDAYRKLIERIYGLEIDSRTVVRNFLTVSDEIRMAAQSRLRGMRTGVIAYQPDGIVTVQMSVTIDQITKVLKTILDEKYDGEDWTRSRIEKISKNSKRKTITVVGMGALDTGVEGDAIVVGRGVWATGAGYHIHSETETILEETVVIVMD